MISGRFSVKKNAILGHFRSKRPILIIFTLFSAVFGPFRDFFAKTPCTFDPYDPKKTDVWSFGVVIYVIATHRMPFKESLGIKSLRKQVNSMLTWPKDFQFYKFMQTLSRILDRAPSTRVLTHNISKLDWFRTMQKLELEEWRHN